MLPRKEGVPNDSSPLVIPFFADASPTVVPFLAGTGSVCAALVDVAPREGSTATVLPRKEEVERPLEAARPVEVVREEVVDGEGEAKRGFHPSSRLPPPLSRQGW